MRLRYIFEIDVNVPHFWTKEDVEFHRNESSWCASNGLDELNERYPGDKDDAECPCHRFTAEFVAVSDDTPQRKLRTAEEVQNETAMRKLVNSPEAKH